MVVLIIKQNEEIKYVGFVKFIGVEIGDFSVSFSNRYAHVRFFGLILGGSSQLLASLTRNRKISPQNRVRSMLEKLTIKSPKFCAIENIKTRD